MTSDVLTMCLKLNMAKPRYANTQVSMKEEKEYMYLNENSS